MDAASTTSDERATCEVTDCIAFLKEMEDAMAETEHRADGPQIVTRKSGRAICFSFYDSDAAAAASVEEEALNVGLGGLGVHAGSSLQ